MKYFIALFFAMTLFSASAQIIPFGHQLDISPLDISYYPVKYPILKIQDRITEPLVMRVIYSRPHLSGRTVFGNLVEYGEVWRLGANEATEIEFFKNVVINNKKIPKGRYTIYAIPYSDKWTLIINKDTDVWGSFRYLPAKDILRADLPVEKHSTTENMVILFEQTSSGANMNILWGDVKVSLPIKF